MLSFKHESYYKHLWSQVNRWLHLFSFSQINRKSVNVETLYVKLFTHSFYKTLFIEQYKLEMKDLRILSV